MARQYLTVEDVDRLRAGGAEIVVDSETIVTPQALEYAESAGVSIKTATGAYAEPPPDRGPDAAFAMRELPNLPEPTGGAGENGAIVTAVGKNRPGVLGEITGELAALGASVLDVSQRVVGGYFHLVFTIDLAGAPSFGDVQARLSCLGGPDDYAVRVMHERVFGFMHRV